MTDNELAEEMADDSAILLRLGREHLRSAYKTLGDRGRYDDEIIFDLVGETIELLDRIIDRR